MQKTILLLAAILLLATPQANAKGRSGPGPGGPGLNRNPWREHAQQQRRENQAFRESVQGLSPQERAEAAISHRNNQHKENMAFGEDRHQENISKVKERLDQNPHMTAAEKDEVLDFLKQQHQDRTAHWSDQHAENMGVLQRIASSDMNADEAKGLLKDHFRAQREENRAFRHNRKDVSRAKRREIRERTRSRHREGEADSE